MWGITEAELHEREYSAARQKELTKKVKKREELLERLEKNRQHRDASMKGDGSSSRKSNRKSNRKTQNPGATAPEDVGVDVGDGTV